uniref:Ras protein specific guanine nucleotide releasing factor 2 n=1 Tax=Poecilia latipinna TaxID=48699 RepID=A0A3B3U8A3_9TELE
IKLTIQTVFFNIMNWNLLMINQNSYHDKIKFVVVFPPPRSDARLHKDDVDICFSKTLNSCKVPQIRYASVERLLERLTDLRFLSIDFLNTFLHTYRIFTTAAVVIDKLADIYKKPFTSIPVRSLELFFATNQGAWGSDPLNNKSPRLCRKFSSPPPISIPSRTSSPVHCRKLSLSSPVGVKVGALDLSTTPPLSAANSPTSSHSPSISSPPPGFNRLPFGFSSPPPTTTRSPSLPQASGVSSPPPASTRAPHFQGTKEQNSQRRCLLTKSGFIYLFLFIALLGFSNSEKTCDKEFIIRRAATNRVLNVLRHWVSKHSQDFDLNSELKTGVISLLEEVLRDPDLLPQERKAATNILRCRLFTGKPPLHNCHIYTELTDHLTLCPLREFLGQGWMKVDKTERTPYIMKTSQHFNDMSNLVASQIMAHSDVGSRAGSIEKWLAVADICRCLNNYNGVLEITSALNRSAIYRLKKTWAKVCKQTKALMDRLQKIVSSEGRFKNLRETLKNCNPPCVPYLGMYLTDLAFIEEGTPNFTEEGLVNFSKMRMISHIIREIRQFQQAPYRIEHQSKVTQFLLDKTVVMDEDTLYELSLKIEPRVPPG